jgi:integrase
MSQLTTQRKITIRSLLWEGVNLTTGRVETPPTKNGTTTTLVIVGETLDLLRQHHAREQAAGRGGRKDYIFQSPKLHQPIEPKKHVDWLFDHSDFDGKTFKHLRSTTLSRLFTHAKMDVTRVMSISGHKTARVLLEHYAHADADERARVIEEHADVLLGK